MTASAPVVVTNCTSRKRGIESAVTLRGLADAADLEALSDAWLKRLRNTEATCQAGSLYVGRSFFEARHAAARLNASLQVVSAGLGLVAAETQVPRYDATVSTKDAELQRRLARLGASASEWWLSINGGPAITRLLEVSGSTTVFMALPSTYLALIAEDLRQVHHKDVSRLRIFTSEAGAQALPTILREAWMPYDARLERIDGWSGTQADFPQRALGHFVEKFGSAELPLVDAREAVEVALAPFANPVRISRMRLDDGALRAWVRTNWDTCGGSTARLLAHLRHDAGHACEQGRFAQLCREVRESTRKQHLGHA